MKKFLAESELARDERFVRTNIADRVFDPRGAKIAVNVDSAPQVQGLSAAAVAAGGLILHPRYIVRGIGSHISDCGPSRHKARAGREARERRARDIRVAGTVGGEAQ